MLFLQENFSYFQHGKIFQQNFHVALFSFVDPSFVGASDEIKGNIY